MHLTTLKFFSVKIGPSGNPPKIIFRWSGSNISEVSQVVFLRFGPSWNHLEMIVRWSGHKKNLRSFSSFVFVKCPPPRKSWKNDFSGISWNQGPSGPPWMQERQILFRIALTRALYDRMAPQLCLFYVPGQPSKTVKRSVRKKTWSGG